MRQKKLYAGISAALMILLLTGCGKNREIYDSGRDGYTGITAVEGISFDVMSEVARNATAITNISEDMSFESNQTYVYKDGGTQYFIFRMDSIVFAAQKGTNFGLREAGDKLAALQDGNIMGIYFTSPRKKLDFVEDEKNGIYKLSATVTAQVAVTSELYNDFAGRFSYINDGTDEWALFVGSRGEDFRNLKDETREVITYMAASMAIREPQIEKKEKLPAISLGGEEETAAPSVSENGMKPEETPSESPKQESDTSGESETGSGDSLPSDVLSENTPDADPVKPDDAPSSPVTNDMLPEEPPEIIEVEEIPAETEETDKDNGKKEEITGSADDQTSVKPTVRADNQRAAKPRADGTVYSSDIYSMLSLGKKAYATALLSEDTCSGTVEVCADRILIGKEAADLIRKAFSEGRIYGEYFEAPEGCMWHAVHYTVAYPENADGYINVKLRGMDGEDLRFRGIVYPHRSYDIKISDKEFYAFYAVPNGCPEYVLELGEGNVDNAENGMMAAYYRYVKD